MVQTYKEYADIVKKNYPDIHDSHLLFWNLWNINFLMDQLEKDKETHAYYYEKLQTLWKDLWQINDTDNQDKEAFYQHADSLYPFDEDEFEKLNDFDVSEASIKEMLVCFDNILFGLKNNTRYGSVVHNSPLNVIYVMLDNKGLGLVQDNMDNDLVSKEVNAQVKLSEELVRPGKKFTYKDRNIFRS